MHMKMTRNAARVLSVVMALAMVLAMAVPAGAESDAVSVDLRRPDRLFQRPGRRRGKRLPG